MTLPALPAPNLTIYGASDDCLELEGAINEEFYLAGGRATVELHAPTGARLYVTATYCADPDFHTREEWVIGVKAAAASTNWLWPIWITTRPGRPDDPALCLYVPEGTIATLDGE